MLRYDMSVNVALYNYGVEMAICDYSSNIPVRLPAYITELNAAAENWMNPENAFPWRTRNSAGHIRGLLFDSRMKIVVTDDEGKVLDQFKGSECMDLTYVHKEYSIVPYKMYRSHNPCGRISAMEITQNGYQLSTLPISPHQYSRDLIHIGLSRVNNISHYDEHMRYLYKTQAFIVDLDTRIDLDTCRKSTKDNSNKTHSVNAFLEEIKIDGPTFQKVFAVDYGFNPPKVFQAANTKDCDSLYDNLISKAEFKE